MAEKNTKAKPKLSTASKRMLQNEKKKFNNRVFKSRVKTALKTFKSHLADKNPEATQQNLASVYSLMDKAVKRGIFKKNTAGRIKSKCAGYAAKEA